MSVLNTLCKSWPVTNVNINKQFLSPRESCNIVTTAAPWILSSPVHNNKLNYSSGDEIANVIFFLQWHRTRTTKYNRLVHKFRHRWTLSCVRRRFTKFSEITRCNVHYAIQGHSRSPILVPINSSYTISVKFYQDVNRWPTYQMA